MAAHFKHHSIASLLAALDDISEAVAVKPEPDTAGTGGMTLQKFNLLQVLEQGTILVASEGQVT